MHLLRIVLLVATALAALANWSTRVRPHERLEEVSKPLATIGVIGLALVSGAPGAQVAVAAVALVLCLAGDVALLDRVDRFVIGLASFLLGHLVFIGLFAQYGMSHVALLLAALSGAVVLVLTVGRVIVRSAAASDPGLRVPVTAYLLVISAMTVCGWSTGKPWVIAGSTLFVISDSVLGWRQFVRERPWMALTVMVTYHAAIASLALSLW
jgi:alkenylglycerophosphocholine hydrolase